MYVLIIVLIILIISLIISIFLFLQKMKYIIYKNKKIIKLLKAIVKSYEKEVDDLLKKHHEFLLFMNEVQNQKKDEYETKSCLALLKVAHSILFMLLHLAYNNKERYSFYFNNLYFLGIPKEVLNDFEQIMEFHNNCLNNKYIIEEGEKPFKYKFILKEEKDNNSKNLQKSI